MNRRRKPEDRRSMFVSLTEQGEQLRIDSESAVAEVQKEILAPLNENEQEVLCSLLKRIADSNNHLSRVPIRL
ncbi:MAG: hypothetical protein M1154_10230 [Gammaproteobacteria bacterium]|nr:hypothetical protein [Gammaproteobacteria bacterium]